MENLVKYLLTRAGERLSTEAIAKLSTAANCMETGRWMRAQGYDTSRRVDRRAQLFDLVGAEVGTREVLYLEFGVYQGAATRYWSKLLTNPKSRLHGFDSFEGLPEDWRPDCLEGHFSVKGQLPQIDDPRVQFFKGWFDQTLPHYTVCPHQVLVLNLDADLYSSTIYVLNTLEKAIVPGTYIYFDEFNHPQHELRAFEEFITRTSMNFDLRGADQALGCVLFQRKS
ncbi:MAG TPA: TylF/MycF/NovP-related O-methyltransferase [Terriglobales bacterium]|nr:TylF/MycF/NovP-related O-methyltransferase [Terriglobales bacterium]